MVPGTIRTILLGLYMLPLALGQELQREIRVPLQDGRLEVAALVRALGEEFGLDAAELDLPSASVDLRGLRGHLLLVACEKLLLDTVRFRRSVEPGELMVVVDRVRAREVRRALRGRVARLASLLTGEELPERSYALALPEPNDPARPLVVLVHGVESGPEVWDELRGALAPSGAQLATFAYPNDGSCEAAAAALADRLRALAPQRVRIVAHSMGGLVARDAVEDPELDPGNVEVLVLIGTPNAGSNLGGLRFGLEAAQFVRDSADLDRFGEALLGGMREHLLDGVGEAGGDLLPGSVFLTRMAARERNPRVRYHLVLGTRSVLSAAQFERLRETVAAAAGRQRWSRVARPRIEAWIADLDELVDGAGDGAVAVARGRLEGVESVLVDLDHLGLVRRRGLLGRSEEQPVFELVRGWVVDAEGGARREGGD
jgi:pimeloyl-ACP methyl ester carboxylesterase